MPRKLAAAVLPISGGSLAKMQSLRFWLKTDAATAVAVLLSEEKPGGNYSAVVWSPQDAWQQIELAPEDFALSEGPSDPRIRTGNSTSTGFRAWA